MSSPTFDGRPNIFPAICYKDSPAIIDWLVSVFGFEKQFVVPIRLARSPTHRSSSVLA